MPNRNDEYKVDIFYSLTVFYGSSVNLKITRENYGFTPT